MKTAIFFLILCLSTSLLALPQGGGAGGGNRQIEGLKQENQGMVDQIMNFFRKPASSPSCHWANEQRSEIICDRQLFRKVTAPGESLKSEQQKAQPN